MVGRLALFLAAPVLLATPACTDLTESPVSQITAETFYNNEEEVLAGLAAVYNAMRSTLDQYWNLSQVTSDETIVPTRGPDWFDDGRWLEIHRQGWGPTSSSGLDDVNGMWNNLFTGVVRANYLLEAVERVGVANQAAVEAEIRTLRAFYYYLLMDMFGGVPIATDIEATLRPRATRREVFDFIDAELRDAVPVLPASWPANMHGRVTRGAANAILASLYINAGVFAQDNPPEQPHSISATSYNSCNGVTVAGGQNACQAAADAALAVINSGHYTLAQNWRSNFTADNHTSPENILVVKHTNQADHGLNFMMRALHYNQIEPTPWNGFATLADTYFAFDQDDRRSEIFLAGPQVSLDTGEPITDRQGAPLVYTPEIRDPTAATEAEGVRVLKFPPDPNRTQWENANDYTVFRLAEMYLIRAEALSELGQTADATGLVNDFIRARVFDPAKPLAAGMSQTEFRDAILLERLFELNNEAKRRQDLIRHGRYLTGYYLAPEPGRPSGCINCTAFRQPRSAEAHRLLMPIPQTQLAANPELVQTAGY